MNAQTQVTKSTSASQSAPRPAAVTVRTAVKAGGFTLGNHNERRARVGQA